MINALEEREERLAVQNEFARQNQVNQRGNTSSDEPATIRSSGWKSQFLATMSHELAPP